MPRHFNGSGEFIDSGLTLDLDDYTDFTFGCRFKSDGFDVAWQFLMGRDESSTWRLSRQSAGDTIGFALPGLFGNGNIPVNDGKEHTVVLCYRASGSTNVFLYIDGIEDFSGSLTIGTDAATVNMHIGRNVDQTERDWKGTIADVFFSSAAWTPGEVIQYHHRRPAHTIRPQNSVYSLPLIGQPVEPDFSGRGNHTQATNTTPAGDHRHRRNILRERLLALIDTAGGGLSSVSNTITKLFSINEEVSNTSTHQFNIREEVSNTLTKLFNIRQEITNTTTHLFGIGGTVSNSITNLFNILNTVSNTTEHRFNILNTVSNSVTKLFNIRQEITNTLTNIFNIEGLTAVSNTITSIFNIESDNPVKKYYLYLARRTADLFLSKNRDDTYLK